MAGCLEDATDSPASYASFYELQDAVGPALQICGCDDYLKNGIHAYPRKSAPTWIGVQPASIRAMSAAIPI